MKYSALASMHLFSCAWFAFRRNGVTGDRAKEIAPNLRQPQVLSRGYQKTKFKITFPAYIVMKS